MTVTYNDHGRSYTPLTLRDIGSAAKRLAVDSLKSTWSVEFRAIVHASRINGRPYLHAECEVWRAIDEDYSQKEAVRVGSLVKRDGVLYVALLDGLTIAVISWIAKLCKEHGFEIEEPPSALALRKALDG